MQRDRHSALSWLTLALLAPGLARAQAPAVPPADASSSAAGAAPAKPAAAAALPAKPTAPPAKPASPPAKPAARASRHAAARPESGPRPGLADSVWLRDGSRLRGTLLRVEPDSYVLLLGVEGVRTIPWRSVARIENAAQAAAGGSAEPSAALLAPCCADELAEDESHPAEADWADLSLGWDLRAEGVSLFKHYTVDGHGEWYGGEGWGGAASLSLHFRGPTWFGDGPASRWAEFELGVGDALHSVAWKEGAENQTKFLENQTSMILGAHFASGHWGSGGGAPWSGVVLGVAWVPTYVSFFGSTDFESTGKFHPAGLRMTLDWGRVALGRRGLVPGLRASFTWLPYVGNLPTLVSFGLGVVCL